MNIFVLDTDPTTAAEYHCDKHVVKMILETAQLLSTAHHVETPVLAQSMDIYKPTHANHPCAIWVRESWPNYMWTYDLLLGLCNEYTKRYKRVHKTSRMLMTLLAIPPDLSDTPTPWVQCVPDDCKSTFAVDAYRQYYLVHKSRFAAWNHSHKPDWYIL